MLSALIVAMMPGYPDTTAAQQTDLQSIQVAGWPDVSGCRSGSFSDNPVVEGWCVAIDTRRGNCIACHTFNVSPWPPGVPVAGNLAPPLVAMIARFPERSVLRAIIEDVTAGNPDASMPPYLKHGILNTKEIDSLIALLESL